ncbi:phage head closure protein [Mesorhizobium sp. DCY119]|uniref:phage head closure protein n=1 Tax=Mesorhizobium sp. DCY119 TaxID=2108445 RepID=UPI000E6D4D20|nr:phage head closure protein [Mesorhizobium sp. DCY119]RJG44914.1 head-tail adaptor protein [Mesorhizobium sp. DCY119]
MTIGQMQELVVPEQYVAGGDDGYGNPGPGIWTGVEAWARIQPLKGSETVIAARLSGKQPVVIHLRWTPDLSDMTTAWRVRHADSGVIYDIKSVANMDEKREFLELLAERIT